MSAYRRGGRVERPLQLCAAPLYALGDGDESKTNRDGGVYLCAVSILAYPPKHVCLLLAHCSLRPGTRDPSCLTLSLCLCLLCLSVLSIRRYSGRMHLAVSPGLYSLEDLLGVRNGILLDFLLEVSSSS